jgi:hypothetical protein
MQKVAAASLMRFSGLNQFFNMNRFTQVMSGSPKENRILVKCHVWELGRNALHKLCGDIVNKN